MKIERQSVTLLWHTPEPEQTIELAGRTCYKSEDNISDDSAGFFCQLLLSSGHHSVIEHAVASFRIVCDRGISHEIVRHRLASYSQESTRYCNYSHDRFQNQITVIEPPDLDFDKYQLWQSACERAEKFYFVMLENGASAQIARSVLPTCLKTELVMTANFREWRHFITLRMSPKAHPQIAEIAYDIGTILRQISPHCFS